MVSRAFDRSVFLLLAHSWPSASADIVLLERKSVEDIQEVSFFLEVRYQIHSDFPGHGVEWFAMLTFAKA